MHCHRNARNANDADVRNYKFDCGRVDAAQRLMATQQARTLFKLIYRRELSM